MWFANVMDSTPRLLYGYCTGDTLHLYQKSDKNILLTTNGSRHTPKPNNTVKYCKS